MTVKLTDAYRPFEEKARILENKLYLARKTIVDFMAPTFADALTDFRSCSSHRDFSEWQGRVIDLIVSKAEVDPKMSHFEERGLCPLCKGGTRGPYDEGFKIPSGLEKHLFGQGNTSQCPVTEAAFGNARYALRDQFEAAEELVRQQLEERRSLEQTFLIDPTLPPQLIDDEGFFTYKRARSAEELAWAEERLTALGFQKEMTTNVIAYKLFREGRLYWPILVRLALLNSRCSILLNRQGRQKSKRLACRTHGPGICPKGLGRSS
jgi:hypothetical protein